MSFQLQDKEEVMTRMNQDMLRIRDWCFSNKLYLTQIKQNLSTCQTLMVNDFCLSLLGKELEPVTVVWCGVVWCGVTLV